jgi:DNA primase
LGTALTAEQIRLLRRYTKNVVMLFDSDTAGESAMIRSLDLLIEEEMDVRVAVLDPGEDPDSFVRKHGIEALNDRVQNAQSLFDYKLRVLTEKHNRTTIEGKARISTEMLFTLAKMRNHIVQEGYLRKLAQELSVSEQALGLEMKKVLLTPPEAEKPVALASPSSLARPVERSLLRLLLEEEHLIAVTQQEIAISDFQDERVKPVVQQIFDLSARQESLSVSKSIHSFQDQETLHFLSELMAVSHPVEGDKEILRKDYVNRIKDDRRKFERKDLCFQIQQAEAQGQEEKLNELKERFNQLIKRES